MASPRENPDDVLTSPGEELGFDPTEPPEAPVTAAYTLTLDRYSGTLKVRKVKLVITTGPDAGRELLTDRERIRVGNAELGPVGPRPVGAPAAGAPGQPAK